MLGRRTQCPLMSKVLNQCLTLNFQLNFQHYGFTDEELDFIINYDIKYRMGRESEKDV